VLDGSKSFYGRIAGDDFVCKDISCLIGIESAMDFKAFGKKQWSEKKFSLCGLLFVITKAGFNQYFFQNVSDLSFFF